MALLYEIQIITFKHQKLNLKLDVPHFWGNHTLHTIILEPKVLKRGRL